MADYVTLMGAEQVAAAGRDMARAAETMQQAASSIAYSMETQRALVDRLEAALNRLADVIEAKGHS